MARRRTLLKVLLVMAGMWLVSLPLLAFAVTPTIPELPGPVAQVTATRGTPTITPTLAEVYVTVITELLNVRSGPGVVYPSVGTIPEKTRVRLIGINADASWYVIDFEGDPQWISGYIGVVKVEGDPLLLPVYEPPPTPTPTITPTPTATPVGVFATVTGTFINVRTGPGTVYPVIGRLNRNQTVQIIGANRSFTWWVINFRGQQAWIQNLRNVIRVAGDRNTLPIVAAPPTPTPLPPTPTPSAEPRPDIVLVTSSLNPQVPQPGQSFTLSATIQNQGNAPAGEFAVATSFEPGGVYAAQTVPGLAAGQQAVVTLTATVNGTGVATIAIVLDLNNQLNENEAGKANNKPTFSYRVDRAYVSQGSVQIAPNTSVDIGGLGTQDINYNGSLLAPINGAVVGALPGMQLTQVHYDFLTPSVVNNGTGIPQNELTPGLIIGVYTADNKRGVLRVTGFNGANLILEYFVYTP